MSLAAGVRLGAYEILSLLGAGGMGEVYRARDTRLGRDVAIKILPSSFSADPDRLNRFEQEARASAALNHPGILAVYDIGVHPSTSSGQGAPFIVSELLEGESLRERLASGPLPPRKAVDVAVQIARGLAAAHEKGIVHRDLKPENLFVTTDGRVKILDFGLAKLTQPATVVSNATSVPTTPKFETQTGLMLGTLGYMAPEQVRAQAVDHRADIFAFGAILYEMLSGRRAFQGDTTPDMMTAILKEDPPDLPAEMHATPALARIIDRCLEKTPGARFQSAGDLAFALEALSSQSERVDVAGIPSMPTSRRSRDRMIAATLGCTVGAMLAAAAVWLLTRPVPLLTSRLSIVLPENRPLIPGGSPNLLFAISPDASRLVYVGRTAAPGRGDGAPQLHVRSLSDLSIRTLSGTERPRQPFFSPDGQWVGFFTADGALRKVSLAGGAAVTLADKLEGSHWMFGTWTDEGTIVFGRLGTGLLRLPADGGVPSELTKLDQNRHERRHEGPEWIPGTKWVLFDVTLADFRGRIEAVSLENAERRVVLENARRPHHLTSGHLLFLRDEALLVVPFDEGRLAVTGPAVPIVDAVQLDSLRRVAQLSVSRAGAMAYVPVESERGGTLGWVTRRGTFEPLAIAPADYDTLQLSPDGRRVALTTRVGVQRARVDIGDLDRGTLNSLTPQDHSDSFPIWSPDGSRVAMNSRRGETSSLYWKDLSGREGLLVQGDLKALLRPGSWSPDGKVLVYTVQSASGQHDIWTVGVDGKPQPSAWLNSSADEHSPRFSPDGRWIAYVLRESDREEVHIRRFPDGPSFRVSTDGGVAPVWARSGRELFFEGARPDTRLKVASVTPDGEMLRVGIPQVVLDLSNSVVGSSIGSYGLSGNFGPRYDVSLDGAKFLRIRIANPLIRELVIVQNWFEEVKRLVAGPTN